MKPEIIKGGRHTDERGALSFNNSFNALQVKRFYMIENANTGFKRGWQGHKIEQRWFLAVAGKFEIRLIAVDDWEKPSKNPDVQFFVLDAGSFDVLHTPAGYISCIQALEPDSKLLVMADYMIGEVKDEYRFDIEYFK